MTPIRTDLAELNAALLVVSESFRRGFARVVDPSRYFVLHDIVNHDGVRPIEIADRLDILPSSVTRHVGALVDAGFVEALGNPHDRRSSILRSTEAGVTALGGFDAAGVTASGQVLNGWEPAEIASLTALLLKLRDSWSEHGDRARTPRDLGAAEPKGK